MKLEAIKRVFLFTAVLSLFVTVKGFAEQGSPPAAGGYVPAPAVETEKPTASAEAAFLSQYIWRGFELSKDSLVIEPSLTVGYKGFSVNLWGNLDTRYAGDPNEDSKWTETDFTLSYSKDLGPFAIGVGYIYYALATTRFDSQEFYGSIGLNTLLTPTLTLYREVAHLPAWYLSFGLSHSFELPRNMSLDLAGSVGYYYSDDNTFTEYNDDLTPTNKKYRDFHNGLLSATLTIPFGKYFSFSPTVAYSFPLSEQADNLITATSFSGKSDFVYGGAKFSMTF